MISRWAYILIGDDQTGKTTFQKYLIWYLCNVDKFDRLYTNQINQIVHRNSPRKLKTLFTINRSVQEKMGEYKTVDNYFDSFFKDADICILSSHSHSPCIDHIRTMIERLEAKYYNVCAVFFTNHLNKDTEQIASLKWSEKLLIHNPASLQWESQIDEGARNFAEMIICKASIY